VPVTYCERWNTKLCRPVGHLSRAQARERDLTDGRWYTIVLGELARPDCYLEVAWENAHLGVWFLDEDCRPWLHYSFTRVDEKRLFLDSVVRWEYPPSAGRRLAEARLVETITYRQDGTVHQEIEDPGRGEVILQDFTGVPLDINWEPVPRFGDYRSVARLDRAPAER
jgi:hypothetical protein